MTELSTADGTSFTPSDINNKGQIVGDNGRAVLWEQGVIRDLGSVFDYFSNAYDINGAGQIVGVSESAGDNFISRATLWNPTQ